MEPCAEKRQYQSDSALGCIDSSQQIDLSAVCSHDSCEMGSTYSNIWKGGYLKKNFPPLYQYPFAEWIPNRICYADYDVRKRSFDLWPKQMRPSAEQLVKAGFFYKGRGDTVECFFCGISLHDWETKDNVVYEHIKWSPSCNYMKMIGRSKQVYI